jgi:hypothetical protein
MLGKGDNQDGKDKLDKGKVKGYSERLFLTYSFPFLHLTGSQNHALTRATMRTARVMMGMASVTIGMARREG